MFGKIIGTGSYVPEYRMTNNELAKYVDTSDEWIAERTGIRCRHIMGRETTADMAALAADKAIEDAEINVDEIDMIIVSSVSSNLILPNTACFVQEHIGAKNASCFDINTACTGFIMAYNTTQAYINSGLINTALIIGAEGLSRIVDWSDRGTCILFGDGAGAAVIRKDKDAVFETVMKADGTKGKALTCSNHFASRKRLIIEDVLHKEGVTDVPDNRHKIRESANEKDINAQVNLNNTIETVSDHGTYVEMDGREIFRFAVKQVPECINELMQKAGITADDVDMFILHQANLRILQGITKRLNVSSEKVPVNVEEYGNMSSACIPILLDDLKKNKKINKGDKIVMSGFGAGVTLSATYMEF